ncbi:MAG: Ig-like domain repeat protein [Gemmataceae bacterium]
MRRRTPVRHTPSSRSDRSLVRLYLQPLEERSTPALFAAQTAQTFSGLNNNGCVATGYFNNDGLSDLVIANYGNAAPGANPANAGQRLTVVLGQGNGQFGSASNLTVGSDQHVSFVTVADVNKDNAADLVCVSVNESEVGYLTVFLGDGNGGFSKKTQVTTGGSNSSWVGVAQLTDSDADPDVLVCSFGKSDENGNNVTGQNMTVFQGDGAGGFGLINIVAAGTAFIPTAGAIADFDGDGHQDVALTVPDVPPDANADQPNGLVYVFTGNGGGGFVQGNIYDSGGPLPISMQAADLNGDNRPDLVVANAGNPDSNSFYANFGKGTSVGVLLGSGNANFGGVSTYTAGLNTGGSTSAFAVAVADFNQDGRTDVAAITYGHPVNGTAARVAVYRGDGSGNLSADPDSPFTTAGAGGQYLAVGSFDSNPTPDLVTVGDSNKVVSLLNQTVAGATTQTALVSNRNPSVYGDAVTFTATVSASAGTPTGTVTFYDGATQIGSPVTLDATLQASITTSTLAAFDHTVTAKYNGAAGFAASTSPAVTQVVGKAVPVTTLTANPTAVTAGGAVTLTATVTGPGGPPTGSVFFFAGAVQVGNPVALVAVGAAAQAVLTTTDLPVGTQSITARYSGNSNLTSSVSAPVTVTVSPAAVSTSVALTASSNPSEFGVAVTFTAAVTATAGVPTGTVSFFDGATLVGGPVTLSAGSPATAAFTTTTLGVGSHSITAVYSGAAGFNPSTSAAVAQTVNPTSTITALTTSGSPSFATQGVTLTAVVTAAAGVPAGGVQFYDGAAAISGVVPLTAAGGQQQAAFTTSGLVVGSHSLTARVVPAGATQAASTSAPVTQVVAKGGTAVTLSSPGPVTVTQPVTLTATLAEIPALATIDPTGVVTFKLNGTAIGTALVAGGVAALTVSTLPVRANVLTAEYAGDANVRPQHLRLVHPVGGQGRDDHHRHQRRPGGLLPTGEPDRDAGRNPGPGHHRPDGGGDVPGGWGGAGDGGGGRGVAGLTVSTLPVGDSPITAEYAGDANFVGSTSANYTQSVVPLATVTLLVGSGSPSFATQGVTLTAAVTAAAGAAAGGVQFFDGATAISGVVPLAAVSGQQQAAFTTAALSAGSHALTARFVPAGVEYAASTSAALTQTVAKGGVTVTVSGPGPATVTQPVTLTATLAEVPGLPADPTGVVTFRAGGAVLGTAAVAGGVAGLTVSTLPVGDSPITADYAGDANFVGSTSANYTQSVVPLATVTLLVGSGSPSYVSQGVTLTAAVTAAAGAAAGGVQFFDGATAISGVVPLAAVSGQQQAAFTTAALAAGPHALTARFVPAGANQATSVSAPLSHAVTKAPPVITVVPVGGLPAAGQPATFAASVAGPAGVTSPPTGAVTFLLDGSPIGTAPVVGGVATVTTTALPTGASTITAQFAGDGTYAAGSAQTVAEIKTPPARPPVVIGYREFGVGAGAGHSADARFFNPDGSERFSLNLFPGFTGGVRVTSADLNGDGIADMVAGTGPGSASHVRVIDGQTRAELFAVDPFEPSFTGGVYVSTGDITGDGVPDLVVSPDEGGGPRVRVFDGKTFGQVADFFGIDDPNFRGGARAGVADMNADGRGIWWSAPGSAAARGWPRSTASRWPPGTPARKLFADFFAFEDSLRNGVYVAVGDVDGDGMADLIAGGGPGGAPRVTITSGAAREGDGQGDRRLLRRRPEQPGRGPAGGPQPGRGQPGRRGGRGRDRGRQPGDRLQRHQPEHRQPRPPCSGSTPSPASTAGCTSGNPVSPPRAGRGRRTVTSHRTPAWDRDRAGRPT